MIVTLRVALRLLQWDQAAAREPPALHQAAGVVEPVHNKISGVAHGDRPQLVLHGPTPRAELPEARATEKAAITSVPAIGGGGMMSGEIDMAACLYG